MGRKRNTTRQNAALNVIDATRKLSTLAGLILQPGRRTTIVVLTVRSRDLRPGFEPFEIVDALSGSDAAVYLLTDPWDARRLSDLTNGLYFAFNGGACVLPALDRPRTFMPNHGVDGLIDYAITNSSFVRRPILTDTAADDTDETKELKAEIKRLKGELKRAASADAPSCVIPPSDLYPAGMEEDWLDLAVRVTWALATSAGDKRDRTLPDVWRYANGYAASLAGCQYKADVIRCMVRILLGIDEHHPPYEGANHAVIARGQWGNPVWRSYVKRGSPNAPRVHFTRDGDGMVVFLAFGGHDENL